MCSSHHSDRTSLEYPITVPRTLKPLFPQTGAAATGKRNFDKPKRYYPPIDGGELTDTSGLLGFRKTFSCEGISENASHIITNFRRKDTLSNKETAWRKWASWCLEQNLNPLQAPVKDITKYSTFFFKYGNEKKLHRSPIPAFHECIDGLSVGKHPRTCSFVSVVFNLIPPKRRSMFVWDVKQVLHFVKGKFGDNNQLSNKELSLKVTILFTLTT